MKRGGPLQRRTQLKNGAPLGRGKPFPPRTKPLAGGTEPLTRKPMPRGKRSPVRQPDETMRRKAARRRKRLGHDHGVTWAEVRLLIFIRCGGRCELCSRSLTMDTLEGHHRQTRAVGVDCPGNALALCHDCHHGPLVHAGPARGRELGTIVSRHEDDPCAVPVDLPRRGLVVLGCDGSVSLAA